MRRNHAAWYKDGGAGGLGTQQGISTVPADDEASVIAWCFCGDGYTYLLPASADDDEAVAGAEQQPLPPTRW